MDGLLLLNHILHVIHLLVQGVHSSNVPLLSLSLGCQLQDKNNFSFDAEIILKASSLMPRNSPQLKKHSFLPCSEQPGGPSTWLQYLQCFTMSFSKKVIVALYSCALCFKNWTHISMQVDILLCCLVCILSRYQIGLCLIGLQSITSLRHSPLDIFHECISYSLFLCIRASYYLSSHASLASYHIFQILL